MAHGPNLMTATSIQTNIARPSTANQLADDQARYRDGFAVAAQLAGALGQPHGLDAVPEVGSRLGRANPSEIVQRFWKIGREAQSLGVMWDRLRGQVLGA